MNAKKKHIFNKNLKKFYKKYNRELPWRIIANGYHILVSEFMLQQTQVNRVIPYFNTFICQYPTIQSLAEAKLSDILSLWSGLGFNRRALYLHNSAKIIVSKFNSKIPKDYQILETIKGIGQATAKAIIVYTYNIPLIFIETNIRSVFFILFKKLFKKKEKIHDRDIMPLLKFFIIKENPREWYYSLMDFGSFLKKKYPDKHIQKSHSFSIQSKFKNSFRQIRGNIIKLLIKNQEIQINSLKEILKKDIRIQECITSLIQDGLIQYKKNTKEIITLC